MQLLTLTKFTYNFASNTTSNVAVLGELGRMPMQILRQERIIRYWFKLVMSSRILHRAYTDLKTANCKVWISSVKILLCQLGVGDVWHNQDRLRSYVNFAVQTIVQCLKDQYHQSSNADMADNSKLSSYCVFKND
jgi:hypothetical protein